MPADASVLNDLIGTLEDGERAFATWAKKLDDTGEPELAGRFRQRGAQRARFSAELRDLARDRGAMIREPGALSVEIHRGWSRLTEALASSRASWYLRSAQRCEAHAKRRYRRAASQELSPTLRFFLERQSGEVHAAHAQMRALRASNKNTPRTPRRIASVVLGPGWPVAMPTRQWR